MYMHIYTCIYICIHMYMHIGDLCNQRATISSVLHTEAVWPEGWRRLCAFAPSMVTQRGQRVKRTSGVAWDTTCEQAVQRAKAMDRGSKTGGSGGGSIAATNIACKLVQLQSFVMRCFDKMMTLFGCQRVTKKHHRDIDPTRVLFIANAMLKRNKSFLDHPDFKASK